MAYNRVRARFKRLNRVLSKAVRYDGALFQEATYASDSTFESMSDFVIPGWRTRLARGFEPVYDFSTATTLRDAAKAGLSSKYRALQRFIPPVHTLDYTCTRNEEVIGSNTFVYNPTYPTFLTVSGCVTQFLTNVWGINWPNLVLSPPLFAEAEAMLKAKILQRASRTDFAFGEPLAEVGQTLALIRSPLKSVKRSLRVFSRKVEDRKYRTSRQQAHALATHWAEVQWAVRPNIRTVDDALQATADFFYKKYRDAYQSVSDSWEGSTFASGKDSTVDSFPYSGWTHAWYFDRHYSKSIESKLSVGLKYYHADNGSVSTLLGLRGRDIPGVLWELFPLSFLVDRLWNVHGCLTAMSNFLSSNVKFTGGWSSHRRVITTTRSLHRIDAVPGAYLGRATPSQTNPWRSTDFTYQRGQWIPVIGDAVPPPIVGNMVSSLTKTADLAAAGALKVVGLPGYKPRTPINRDKRRR